MSVIEVGTVVAGKRKEVGFERVLAFSGGPLAIPNWPRRNHHTDEEFARSIGLETPCVSATQYMGYVVSLLMETFGEEWLQRGTLDVKFMRVVPPNASLQAKARVTSREPERGLVLDVWVESESAEMVLSGTATFRAGGLV